jgi:hypothetical protein
MENLKKCKACGDEIAKGVNKCPHCGKDQRNFFMRHKIISILVILFVIGIIGSLGGNGDKKSSSEAVVTATPIPTVKTEDTKKEDVKKEDTKETKQPVKKEDKKDEVKPIKVSAKKLYGAYDNNEVKADKQYKDKVVLVSGEITDIGVTFGQTYVVLSSGEEYSISGVQCFFKDEDEISKVADLNKGDTIKVQGTVDGKSINISVNNCSLK